jgi:DNA-binding NarL/FixJ family response regulator
MPVVPQEANNLPPSAALIANQLQHRDDDFGSGFDVSMRSCGGSYIEPTTIIIEHRALVRDCLARCLLASGLTGQLLTFSSVEEWLAEALPNTSSLVLLCVRDRKAADREHDLSLLSTVDAKIVLLAEDEETSFVLAALNKGIKGYIPMSVSFSVAVEAMHLVSAGGIFVPASCIMNGHSGVSEEPAKRPTELLFTTKQLSVIQALRQGKSNKIIAYELDMAESTVKVHVRNVMRKLKAQNRTQVAFLIAGMDSPS